jgi:integrase/recombinase XerD
MSSDTHLPAPLAGTSLPTGSIVEELSSYDEHLGDVQGLSEGTRRGYPRVAGRLLCRQFGNGDIEIAKLQPSDIRQFLADELEAHKTHLLQLTTDILKKSQ